MYDRTLAIYCFVDDLLKAMQHSEDSRCEFSDAEVVTTAIVAMLFFGGNFESARSFLHSSGMMPRMLSRSRLSRRLSRLNDLIDVVFHQLGQTLKELNMESRYSLDSFPVALCDNIRINRSRLAQGTQFRGYLASKRRYFYGVRVQVVVTVEGLPVEYSILPGGLSDIEGLAHLPLSLPSGADVAADAAYTYYEWEDELAERDGVRLLVGRKRNSKRRDVPLVHDYKQWLRRRIETVFGEITKLFPKKIHATTLSGFILKISLFLFAYQLDKAFIQ
ncbi:MAG: IS982 family transposase [Acidobacteria bacterium]|nr:MAG: IS982 family transposase [Acidobacteriota bacterium]